jgi:hypothetical protein
MKSNRGTLGLSRRHLPTPEDSEIFQRHMRRIVRWHRAINPPAKSNSVELVGIISRACVDYLEFRPRG